MVKPDCYYTKPDNTEHGIDMYLLQQNEYPNCINDPVDGYWRCEDSTLVDEQNSNLYVYPYDVSNNDRASNKLYINSDEDFNLRHLNLAILNENFKDYHEENNENPYGAGANFENSDGTDSYKQICGIIGFFNYPLKLKNSNVPPYIQNERSNINLEKHPQLQTHLEAISYNTVKDNEVAEHKGSNNNWRYDKWCSDTSNIREICLNKNMKLKITNGSYRPIKFQFLIIANKPNTEFDEKSINRKSFTMIQVKRKGDLNEYIDDTTDVLIIKSTAKVKVAAEKTENTNSQERMAAELDKTHGHNVLNRDYFQEYNMIFKRDIPNADTIRNTRGTKIPRYKLQCEPRTRLKIAYADSLQKPIQKVDVRKRSKAIDTEIREYVKKHKGITQKEYTNYIKNSGYLDEAKTTPSLSSYINSSINRERKRVRKSETIAANKKHRAKGISQILTKRRRQHRIRKQIKKKTKRRKKQSEEKNKKTKRHKKIKKIKIKTLKINQ